jgi:glycosyltransferase involved in cell wall biosynthesis
VRVANIIEEGKLGGPQVRMVMVAEAIRSNIETIVVMPSRNSEVFQEKCEQSRVCYKKIKLSRITKQFSDALRYLIFSFFEILALAKYFKSENIQLVHVSGGSWQFKGVIAGKLAGKKILWHVNDTSMPWFILRIFKIVSRLADGIIYASLRSRDYYKPNMSGLKPEFVIPAPVNTEKFDPYSSYYGDEELLETLKDKIVVATIANINPTKGLEVLIRASAEVNTKLDNVVYLIIGSVYANQQSYYKELQQLLIKYKIDNVLFVGAKLDVRPILKRIDVYVCSSHAESSPLSVWEAMSMGKPIVSTDVGDVPVYIKDGFNGFVVDVDDSDSLAEKLAILISNPDKALLFGKRSREKVENELDIKICAQRHIDAYLSILD